MAWNFASFSSLPTASFRFQFVQGLEAKNYPTVLFKPTSSEKHIGHCKPAQSEGVAEESTILTAVQLQRDVIYLFETSSLHLHPGGLITMVSSLKTRQKNPGSSTRTQLDLLEQLTSSSPSSSDYESDSSTSRPTIREQLTELIGTRHGDFSLPLGKKLKSSLNTLTISQKRNIKRQAYLNEVSRRNDSIFFATIGAFVILPPIVILSVAILTGYVQLFP